MIGQLTDAVDAASQLHFTYDGLGRVKTGATTGTTYQPNATVTNTYDAAGDRVGLNLGVGGTTVSANTYAYDDLHRMTSVAQTQVTGGAATRDKLVTFAYDASGQRTETVRAELDGTLGTLIASTTSYAYDAAGRLTDLHHQDGSTTQARYEYSYDTAGRITSLDSHLDGTATYGYDKNGQLTSVVHTNVPSGVTIPDVSYAYDETGNRDTATVATSNRVTNDGTFTYLYDDEGNVTRKTTIATGVYTIYSYDHRSRLTAAESYVSGTTLTKAVYVKYDLLDRRIMTDVDENGDGKTDRGEAYVYDNPGKVESNGHATDDILAVYTKTYNPTTGVYTGMFLSTRNLHGPGVDEILAEETVNSSGTSVETRWTLGDNLGTIRDRVSIDDTTGAAVHNTHVIFDAFSAITAEFDDLIGLFPIRKHSTFENVNGLVSSRTRHEWDSQSRSLFGTSLMVILVAL